MRLITTTNLEEEAFCNERLRQHFNIHESFSSPIQVLVNFLTSDTFIAPHDHSSDNKNEYLLLLEGSIMVVYFDRLGGIKNIVELVERSNTIGVEIFASDIHTVVCSSKTAKILEIKQGPFVPEKAKNNFIFDKIENIGNLKTQIETFQKYGLKLDK